MAITKFIAITLLIQSHLSFRKNSLKRYRDLNDPYVLLKELWR